MIKEILVNRWFFSFIIGWMVFFILVDWRKLAKNIWGGIAASGLECWQDTTAKVVGMYHMNNTGISILGISIFFTFGVVFTMGILFLQYIPKSPKLQLIHILVFSFGFIAFESITESYGLMVQTHWNLSGSFFDNIIIMGSLVWLKQYILRLNR
jgi:hypothetical protein